MSEYYQRLGLKNDCSQDDIKNAFRKLAREHHPDKGGDKEEFQKIQEAYETLSDPEKRQQYDSPNPFMSHDSPFGFNMNSFFNQRRNQGPRKKQNHFYNCKITLRDIYFGLKKTIKITRFKICENCNTNCNFCNGSGNITQHIQMGPFTQVIQSTCNHCSGSGRTNKKNESCKLCDNNCKIKEEKLVEINIERGSPSEQQITIEGWGEQKMKSNEISGDLVINITCQSNDDSPFTRNRLDLLYTVDISLIETIIGKKITIPHYDGNITINSKIFGIINPNNKYVIENKGLICISNQNSGYQNANIKTGNLIITFNVTYPSSQIKLKDDQIDQLTDVFREVKLI
jgi:DnaJ homolog subfamily A member 2